MYVFIPTFPFPLKALGHIQSILFSFDVKMAQFILKFQIPYASPLMSKGALYIGQEFVRIRRIYTILLVGMALSYQQTLK